MSTLKRSTYFSARTTRQKSSSVVMSTLNDEVEALKAKAAKLRQEAEESAKALGKDISTTTRKESSPSSIASVKPAKSRSVAEVMNVLSYVDFEDANEGNAAVTQSQKLDDLVKTGELSLWKAAVNGSAKTSSPTPLRTYPVSLDLMSNRSGGSLTGDTLGVTGTSVSMNDIKDATIAVTLGATVLGIASLKFLPENVGAAVCYLLALVPIGFIGIGSSAPGIITGAIAQLKGTADSAETKEQRICAHEAGHFLCGYLCGLPIRSYTIAENGFPCVEFHSSSDADAVSSRREFTKEEIAALSVVALSGSVAEVLSFGQARGGESDLIELDRLFRRSKEFIGAQKQQDLTRWGALTSYNLIKANLGKYEKLIESFKEKKSVVECIAVIEACEFDERN